MDLRQLEIVRAIAETGSFTAAGTRLHVSQSAISRQILLLEDEFHERLFVRLGRRVQITAAGEALLQLAHRVFNDIRDTSASITDRQKVLSGSINLVGGMTVCLYVFPPLLKEFRKHGVHILGSFIFGLSTDRADTFDATLELAHKSGLTFAQFVMLTPFCGTVDFERWEKAFGENVPMVEGTPITRYWLIPPDLRPKMFMPHPTMNSEEMRQRTQGVWDRFYSFSAVWKRSNCTPNLRARLAFIFISKLYRQMYASTGIATDSARRNRANRWARWLAVPCRKLFQGKPMPGLQAPPRKVVAATGNAGLLNVIQ